MGCGLARYGRPGWVWRVMVGFGEVRFGRTGAARRG